MTWSRKERHRNRASLDAVRRVMRNETEHRRRWNEAYLFARGGKSDGAYRADLETDLAVAAHLLHQWNDHHRADPEDWAAAARLRGTVQETAKFLGAELEVAEPEPLPLLATRSFDALDVVDAVVGREPA